MNMLALQSFHILEIKQNLKINKATSSYTRYTRGYQKVRFSLFCMNMLALQSFHILEIKQNLKINKATSSYTRYTRGYQKVRALMP